jgi:hypothetical protein
MFKENAESVQDVQPLRPFKMLQVKLGPGSDL